HTESEDQRHDEAEILADAGLHLDLHLPVAGLLHAEEKMQRHRSDDEIDHHRAKQEEHRRGHEIGDERLAFLLVEPWRYERVNLRRNEWEAKKQRPEERYVHVGEELLLRRREDHLHVLDAT